MIVVKQKTLSNGHTTNSTGHGEETIEMHCRILQFSILTVVLGSYWSDSHWGTRRYCDSGNSKWLTHGFDAGVSEELQELQYAYWKYVMTEQHTSAKIIHRRGILSTVRSTMMLKDGSTEAKLVAELHETITCICSSVGHTGCWHKHLFLLTDEVNVKGWTWDGYNWNISLPAVYKLSHGRQLCSSAVAPGWDF